MHQILKVTKYTDIFQTLLHSKSCLAKTDFYHGILLALATTCSMQWGNQLKFIAWAESVQPNSSLTCKFIATNLWVPVYVHMPIVICFKGAFYSSEETHPLNIARKLTAAI